MASKSLVCIATLVFFVSTTAFVFISLSIILLFFLAIAHVVLGLLISCLITIWVRVAQMALLGKNACVGQMRYTNSSNRQFISLVALIVSLKSTDYYTLVSERCLYTSRISCVKSFAWFVHGFFYTSVMVYQGLHACLFVFVWQGLLQRVSWRLWAFLG